MTNSAPGDPSSAAAEASAGARVLRARSPLSRKKRLLFGGIVVLGVYGISEIVALCALYFLAGGWSVVRLQQEQGSHDDVLGTRTKTADEVIHPYLGFVLQPDRFRDVDPNTPHVTEYGFVDTASPIHRRSPGTVVIGLLGGSVALHLSLHGTDALARELQESPHFAGKKIEFVRLAIYGYKQPQQLLAVTYLLSLGAEFDAIVNLDGFNEIVLPLVENIPNDVFASYPRSWHLRVTEGNDITVLRLVGRVAYCRELRRQSSESLANSPFRFSALANLVWKSGDEALSNAIVKDYGSLSSLGRQQMSFRATGPPQTFPDELARFGEVVRIWKQCSLQLQQVCTANGIRYFHFLQPNQYVPGSKPMGREERAAAIDETALHKGYMERGYPLLIRAGRDLARRGIDFHDLTQIFADHPEPLYMDICCHLNQQGNELLGAEIGRRVRENWP